jgi:hypothetical protein
MRPDPEPQNVAVMVKTKCPVMSADTRRPHVFDLFEIQRWMFRVGFKQAEIFVREALYTFR